MTDKKIHKRCCSFCGKTEDEVKKLIAGPTVFICDECVQLCVEIILCSDRNWLQEITKSLLYVLERKHGKIEY